MFAKEINQITLTNDIADRLFDNITTSDYGCDRTFTATLRALLCKRLPANESLLLAHVPLGGHAITADMITERIRQVGRGHSYSIYIVYPLDKRDGSRLLDNVRSSIGEGRRYLGAYAPQEDLRVFYIRKLDGLFYTDGNSTIIFLDNLDTRQLHALQMMIPKYLPKLFANNPLSEEETELLKCFGGKSHYEYERMIEQFAQRLDMRGEMIRSRLKGFETVFEQERLREVTKVIEAYQREYQSYLNSIRSTLNAIQEQQILLAGLESRINSEADGESELMEYFMCNKQLSIMRVRGTELEFVVHGYADIFDEDAFDTYVSKHTSYLYTQIGDNVTIEQMELLYRAIFGGNYKLRLCAAYVANMRNSITPLQDYSFPPESQTYLPNPHIQRFGCIGNYARRFAEYMYNKDYVGAIDQAAVSARNLNFHDSSVMRNFAHTLPRTTIKCVEDANGNLMTPREAIKKLEEALTCQNQSE